MREAAFNALMSRGAPAVPFLTEALANKNDGIVWRSALLLGGLNAANASGSLIGILDRKGRVPTLCCLGAWRDPEPGGSDPPDEVHKPRRSFPAAGSSNSLEENRREINLSEIPGRSIFFNNTRLTVYFFENNERSLLTGRPGIEGSLNGKGVIVRKLRENVLCRKTHPVHKFLLNWTIVRPSRSKQRLMKNPFKILRAYPPLTRSLGRLAPALAGREGQTEVFVPERGVKECSSWSASPSLGREGVILIIID